MWYILLPSLWLGGLWGPSNPCEHHLEVSLQQLEYSQNECWIDLCANGNGLWEWTYRPTKGAGEWEALIQSPLFEVLILAAFLEKSNQSNEQILSLWLERHQATRVDMDRDTERLSWSSLPWTGRVEFLWDTRKKRVLGASFDRIESTCQEKMIFRYDQQGRMEIQWGHLPGEPRIIQIN